MKALSLPLTCLVVFLTPDAGVLQAAGDPAAAKFAGRYMKTNGDKDYIDIREDGTCTFTQGEEGATCDYTAKDNTLTLTLPGDRTLALVIVNDSFIGPDRLIWQKVPKVVPGPPPANWPNFSAKSAGGAAASANLVEKMKVTQSIMHVSQLCVACRLWAAEHNGSFPASVDDLFTVQIINNKKHTYLTEDQRRILHCPLFNDDSQPGYFYHGPKLSDTSPARKILFISRWAAADGKRIVGHVDGSAALETPKVEDVPTAADAAAKPPAAPPTKVRRPDLTPAEEQAGLVQSMGNVKRLIAACVSWAADHDGKFPTDLKDLLDDKYLGKAGEPVLHCPLLGDNTKNGYYYHGRSVSASSPGDRILFYSRWADAEDKQIVGRINGSVVLQILKSEDLREPEAEKTPTVKPTAGAATTAPAPAGVDPAKLMRSMGNVKRLLAACFSWAAEHEGKFPEDLHELQADKYLGKDWEQVIRCPLQADDRKQGYYYYGKKLTASSPREKFLFYSHWESPDGKHIVAHLNGAVVLEVLKKEDYPVAGSGKPATPPPPTPPPGTAPATAAATITLKAHSNPNAKPALRHRVTFPHKEMPSNKGAYVWVIDSPGHQISTAPLDRPEWSLTSSTPGTYKISVEYRYGDVKRLVSNVVELSLP